MRWSTGRTHSSALILVLAATVEAGCNAWDYSKKSSEMTGEIRQTIATKSSDAVRVRGTFGAKDQDWNPWLQLLVEGASTTLELNTGAVAACDDGAGARCGQFVRFKFDDESPFTALGTLDNRGILRFRPGAVIAKEFKRHALLRVEVRLMQGEAPILKFPLAGFTSRVVELCGDRADQCAAQTAPELQMVLNE